MRTMKKMFNNNRIGVMSMSSKFTSNSIFEEFLSLRREERRGGEG